MTSRRRPQPATKPALTSPNRAVPECPLGCGYTGWPDGESSPYLACDGDPAGHQRQQRRSA